MADCWALYRRTIPADTPDEALAQRQRDFYAGGGLMFDLFRRMSKDQDKARGAAAIKAITDEMAATMTGLMKARAIEQAAAASKAGKTQ